MARIPESPARRALLRRAFLLACLTVAWNLAEGAVAVAAALHAGSIALLGFGLDSFVETASGAVIVWRARAEMRARSVEAVERLERRAGKLVSASFVALSLYLLVEATLSLARGERPEATLVGIALTTLSLFVMLALWRAKLWTARRLGSPAMEADAFQTLACLWLSGIVLAGIGLNAALGWWWADPVAALALVAPLLKEAREAWRGEGDGRANPHRLSSAPGMPPR